MFALVRGSNRPMNNTSFTALLGSSRTVAALLLLFTTQLLQATTPGCDGPTFVQDDSKGQGLVVLEAERATKSTASANPNHGPDVAWWEYTTNTASSGAFVVVDVDTSTNYNLYNTNDGAQLEYTIDFAKAGMHYVSVRSWAAKDSDNSIRLAFNGTRFENVMHLDHSTSNWTWKRSVAGFNVPSPGRHTLTVIHREDGTYLDKLVVSSDPNYLPSGYGPDATESTTSKDVLNFYDRRGYTVDYRTGEGFVVLETEQYTNRISGIQTYACRKWERVADASASNGHYMTTAEQGQRSDSSNLWQAPILDFEIRTTVADTFYIHVRHRGSFDNNSIWLAVNYRLAAEWHISKDVTDWVWQSGNLGYVVPSGGTYLLSVIMREDATPIDKIIITTDKNYSPASIGKGHHTTLQEPPGMYFYQGTDLNRTVELPLEYPTRNIAGNGSYKDLRFKKKSDPNAINGKFVKVHNRGTTAGENIILNDGRSQGGPLLEFDINFNQTGTHYLYMRHRSPDGENNSYTYYLDGTKIREVHLNNYTSQWRYYDELPELNVPTTGWHRLTIAMREDGTPLDHLILSTNPAVNASAMPVELARFSGDALPFVNQLYWTTAYEELTATHLVERSASGSGDWTIVGEVAAAGSSRDLLDYELTDPAPLPLAYYRLRTVDQDGSESVSTIIQLKRTSPSVPTALSIYPNPSRGQTTIRFTQQTAGEVLLRVHNLSGRLMASRLASASAGENELPFDTSRLPRGTYSLSAEVNGELLLQRLVVQ